MTDLPDHADPEIRLFRHYLRTGQRAAESAWPRELKYNPWHDPDDGRFTFAGAGRYYSAVGTPKQVGGAKPNMAKPPRQDGIAARIGFEGLGGGGASGAFEAGPGPKEYDIHVIRRGDTLSRIASKRKNLSPEKLASLNGISSGATLSIGQKIRVPKQAFLDAEKAAADQTRNRLFYTLTHGKPPPRGMIVPSIQEQVDNDLIIEKRGSYTFKIDRIRRFRGVTGELQLGPVAMRSRRAQREAGGADRLHTDDGGHYVAVGFNGPRDWFNHFAQDANFNRGTYRILEKGWAKALRAGHKVFVDIVPHYTGLSHRPDSLTVTWYVDGERISRTLPNKRSGKKNVRG
jgi:LysM repeat protein